MRGSSSFGDRFYLELQRIGRPDEEATSPPRSALARAPRRAGRSRPTTCAF